MEYIETNAFWASDTQQAVRYLTELLGAGANTLCISVDPFHAEYVATGLPLSLAKICRDVGFRYFLWQDQYLPALSRLSPEKVYTRSEMESLISQRYILETANSYGLSLGGRAISIETEYAKRKPAVSVADRKPCSNLLSGGHFHVDMLGRYIPPGCTGIAIPLDEAVNGIPDNKYPVFKTLLTGGSSGLLLYAEALGFKADPEGYPSSCALCFHIRRWLGVNALTSEMDAEHNEASMQYW